MANSIRNQIEGTVRKLVSDRVMTEVILDSAAGALVAVITTASAKELKLKRGRTVTALIKATNISLKDCNCGTH
ncbi:MAG: TOBE domain-containing protein [Limisphaerales bacterium]